LFLAQDKLREESQRVNKLQNRDSSSIASDLIFKNKPDFNRCIILFTNQLFVKIQTVASSIDIGKKKSYMPS